MTIRTRLALIYVVAIVVTVGLGGALVSWQLGSALRGALDQALAARATAVLISMRIKVKRASRRAIPRHHRGSSS